MVVKYMHHGDDLVEHRTREASFGAQCTNHSANLVLKKIKGLGLGFDKDGLGIEEFTRSWSCR